MNIENLKKNIPAKAGIYRFVNTVNNKCYIGQAVCLKKRFQAHVHNYLKARYDNPLYRAFNKYGCDCFEYYIEECIEEELDNQTLKAKLDDLEKLYIQKYDSYNKGYNQTLGGDYGVLGYKMTDEQKYTISIKSKEVALDGRYTLYVYDAVTDEIKSYLTSNIVVENIGGSRNSIYKSLRLKSYYKNRYLIAKNLTDLQHLIISVSKPSCTQPHTVEAYYQYLIDRVNSKKSMRLKDVAKDFGLSIHSITKYNKMVVQNGYKPLWNTKKHFYGNDI